MLQWLLLGLFALGLKVSDLMVDQRAKSYYQSLVNQEITPENTVIAFDWHQVLQEQNFRRIALQLFFNNGYASFYIFKPTLWRTIRDLKNKGLIAEQIVDGVLSLYPEMRQVKQQFIDAVNHEPLIEQSVTILKELKSAGYNIYMFSNIAPETLEDLHAIHGKVLKLFDGIYTPNATDEYVQKPNPCVYEFFKNFIAKNGDGDKNILFIDDRESNIKAGLAAGMPGIVFSSPEQLKGVLTDLKLLEIGG